MPQQSSPCRRRPRPAVDYLDSYFVTPAEEDDYYYDDEYEDIYAAVQYQKALARKRAKAAASSMGKEDAEKAQVGILLQVFSKRHSPGGANIQTSLLINFLVRFVSNKREPNLCVRGYADFWTGFFRAP